MNNFFISVGLLIAAPIALAVDIPNTFTAGTPARAEAVNENFDALKTAVDTLEANQIDPSTLGPTAVDPAYFAFNNPAVGQTNYVVFRKTLRLATPGPQVDPCISIDEIYVIERAQLDPDNTLLTQRDVLFHQNDLPADGVSEVCTNAIIAWVRNQIAFSNTNGDASRLSGEGIARAGFDFSIGRERFTNYVLNSPTASQLSIGNPFSSPEQFNVSITCPNVAQLGQVQLCIKEESNTQYDNVESLVSEQRHFASWPANLSISNTIFENIVVMTDSGENQFGEGDTRWMTPDIGTVRISMNLDGLEQLETINDINGTILDAIAWSVNGLVGGTLAGSAFETGLLSERFLLGALNTNGFIESEVPVLQ